MKRDMDLVRAILLLVESSDTDLMASVSIEPLKEQGYLEPQIFHHIKLLNEAGLVEAKDSSSYNGAYWEVKALTWEGHDFLDAAKKDSLWEKAKKTVLQKTGGLPFDVLKATLVQLGKTVVLNEINIDP